MGRKKWHWSDRLVLCKNYQHGWFENPDCTIETHFLDNTTDMEAWRDLYNREKTGLCKNCWEKFKEMDEYKKRFAEKKKLSEGDLSDEIDDDK